MRPIASRFAGVVVILATAAGWQVAAAGNGASQASRALANPLVGVWRIVDVAAADSNGAQVSVTTQPGLRIFTSGGHYSVAHVQSPDARPLLPDSGATDAQQLAAFAPYASNSGSYEVRGDTVRFVALVAKNPARMSPGNWATSTFRVGRDTLWLTQASDYRLTLTNPSTTTLVRVE